MKTMFYNYLAIMGGGAVGVAARMFLSVWITDRSTGPFPLAILLINIVGCILIGLVTGLMAPSGPWVAPVIVQNMITVGILGGFTTFSAFSLQTILLIQNGNLKYALTNIFLSVILCLLGTWLGLCAASFWQTK